MIEFLITGIVFGLTAGLSPGPLMSLIISETLQHGRNAGFKVALAPIFTDVPILLIAMFVLTKISNINAILGLISILGALFIAYLGYESIIAKGIEVNAEKTKTGSLKKAILTNFLNPHPYIFFFSIGGPLITKALQIGYLPLAVFFLSFIFCLVGSNLLIAFLVNKSRLFLTSKVYIYTIKLLGFVLLIFAFNFLMEGIKFLGYKL